MNGKVIFQIIIVIILLVIVLWGLGFLLAPMAIPYALRCCIYALVIFGFAYLIGKLAGIWS